MKVDLCTDLAFVEILAAKKQNPQSDTTALECQIDQLVYQLYELTEEEIRIVENTQIKNR